MKISEFFPTATTKIAPIVVTIGTTICWLYLAPALGTLLRLETPVEQVLLQMTVTLCFLLASTIFITFNLLIHISNKKHENKNFERRPAQR